MEFNEEITYRKGVEVKLDMILAQTLKTNGRVTSLEKWRWMIGGGMAVLIFLSTSIIVPLLAGWISR